MTATVPRSAMLALVLLAVASVALVVFAVRPERRVAGSGPLPGTAESVREPEGELTTPPLPAEEVEPAVEGASTVRRAAELDEGPTIAGRVVCACAFSAGEDVRVKAEVYVGRVNRPGNRRQMSAPVAADGSFAFHVPVDARYALLDVEARFLYLGEEVRALPGERDVVLRPEASAVIVGRVLPPIGLRLPIEEPRWDAVTVSCGPPLRIDGDRDDGARSTVPRGDGSFALAFVPIGMELELRVKSPFVEHVQRVEPLAACEARNLAIALEHGIRIAGRVVDEHGLPVAGAFVRTEERVILFDGARITGDFSLGNDGAKTGADGRFELTGLARKSWKIQAFAPEFPGSVEAFVDGTAGDVDDLVLTLVRGGCIAGTVVWQDGLPAESFTVRATGPAGSRIGYFDEGCFRLCGLTEGPYAVEVNTDFGGIARAAEVHAGEEQLRFVLEMEEVYSLSGVVTDSEGNPPPDSFQVSARSPVHGYAWSDAFSTDGNFLIRGLRPGDWTVEAQSPGLQSVSQRVLVGPDTEPLRLVLGAPGIIRGRVLDSRGAPVTGARVAESALLSVFVDDSGRVTDAEGRFELAATESQTRIRALREGFAPSEELQLTVASGATVEDVVLHLRDACRLTGRVLDASGRPAPGAGVRLLAGRFPDARESDARGEFAFADLPPGTFELEASFAGEIAALEVVLVPGQTATAELRFEKPDPVRVSGRLTRSGTPVVGTLRFRSRSAETTARSGADGRFEVVLQRPGAWRGVVWLGSDWPDPSVDDVRSFELSIPDVDAHEATLDFEALVPIASPEELGH